ncbi:Hypothetical predicted protein [Olea europaea subsp. europaea]|uniref:Uncharacterized protein n=1 Tax=Olea europaea subsp. europaea TaxID=158383 RepID=A0A8S0TAD2_OLEEU|nr:Hypothetical predicted protein [Olea europaea subsp. europaea]
MTQKREELQHMEVKLRAQITAGSELMQVQNNFDAQIKEKANANVKLQEQLHEKEQKIHGQERKIEEKERELHGIRLDNEAAWAKEDLLMEQGKELLSYRRERDKTETEKAQHIDQIHDLKEHIQDKEKQFMELQEQLGFLCIQNRIALETILVKDEQLRGAQSWMTPAQEMDALQSTANRALQAELQERTERCNQLWFGCQTQFGEKERLHLHIQQLQIELTDVREKSGSKSDVSRVSQTGSKDAFRVGRSNDSQVNGNFTLRENSGSLQHENAETVSSLPSGGNTSIHVEYIEHVQGFQFAPSLLGMPTYIPSGQAASDRQHMPSQDQYLQTEQNVLRVDVKYDYEASVNGRVLHGNYLNANSNQGMVPVSMVLSPNEEGQVLESIDKSYYSVPNLSRACKVFLPGFMRLLDWIHLRTIMRQRVHEVWVLDEASSLFSVMPLRNVISLTAMILEY